MRRVLLALALLACGLASRADQDGPYTYTVTNGSATITDFSKSTSGALSITNALGGAPVTSIGSGAFSDCTGLTSVAIPASVTYIGFGAFSSCTALTSVAIPASVTSIGGGAFSDCTGLTVIAVDPANPSFTSLAGVLFNKSQTILIKCPGAKEGDYAVPVGVTSIDTNAFYGCSALTSVMVPDSVATIANVAFSYCTNLASVAIGASVTSIGNGAFNFCTRLTSVTVPASVTTIGSNAFAHCPELRRVYFSGNPPTPGSAVFASTPATLYYLPTLAASWPPTYASRPTLCWNPTVGNVAAPSATVGFSCTITGTTNIPIAVATATNIVTGPWQRLLVTNIPPDSAFIFDDPDAAAYPMRFYRVVAP